MSASLDMLRAVVQAAEDKAWRCSIEVANAQRRLDEAEGDEAAAREKHARLADQLREEIASGQGVLL